MKIIADQDIYQVEDYFSSMGELVLLPGREISNHHLVDADALLIRTVTKVNRALIENTSLKFVGSASSGHDHVDRPVLEKYGIQFTNAPGCNANAVVDYFFAVLAWLNIHCQVNWQEKSVGIIGAGNVGSRLAQRLHKLGMKYSIYDPLLASDNKLAACFASLETVLQQDIVTLHTPLSRSGEYPTYHMLNEERLSILNNDAILINASRGEVIDSRALFKALQERESLLVALDVWESEPDIDPLLRDKAKIATPHIAGYSTNGKLNGTNKIFNDFCQFFSIPEASGQNPLSRVILQSKIGKTELESISLAILQAYPIEKDILERKQNAQHLADNFDWRRNNYSFRKEFFDYTIATNSLPDAVLGKLRALGFR